MIYAFPMAVNLILGTCATVLGATKTAKWPRLYLWLGGAAFGTAMMCGVLALSQV